MSDQFSTVSSSEANKHDQQLEDSNSSPLFTTALIYGAVAGLLMSLFIGVSGFYIFGDQAGFGFLKFLILGAALYLLLAKTKAATGAGKSVKYGISTGMTAGAAAGVVSAIATLIFNSRVVVEGGVDGATSVVGNQLALAGISFFTCLAASLIFTLIFMQFLKDNRPAR